MKAREQSRPASATITDFSESPTPGRARAAETRRRTSRADVQRVNPVALEMARAAAGGDMRRIELHPDGSITVHNQPASKRRR